MVNQGKYEEKKEERKEQEARGGGGVLYRFPAASGESSRVAELGSLGCLEQLGFGRHLDHAALPFGMDSDERSICVNQ